MADWYLSVFNAIALQAIWATPIHMCEETTCTVKNTKSIVKWLYFYFTWTTASLLLTIQMKTLTDLSVIVLKPYSD